MTAYASLTAYPVEVPSWPAQLYCQSRARHQILASAAFSGVAITGRSHHLSDKTQTYAPSQGLPLVPASWQDDSTNHRRHMTDGHTGVIAQTIQLALAPVFVLVAIGNIMNILTTRLGRIVDRSRTLQKLHAETTGGDHDVVVIELRYVDRRIHLIGRALLLLVLSGLAIGVTVGSLFVGEMANVELRNLTGITFFVAIALLMVALVYLLLETRIAASSLRLPQELLELERDI